MRALIVEVLRIIAAAVSITVALGVLRGVPDIAELRANAPEVCSAPVQTRTDVSWIEVEEASALLGNDDVLFADARSPERYRAGHIAAALNVPTETGVADPALLARLGRVRTVIAYCDTQGDCAASRRLAELLSLHEIRGVRVLRGGLPAWLERGLPAEAGAL